MVLGAAVWPARRAKGLQDLAGMPGKLMIQFGDVPT
jgi:hypothetical protein